MMHGPINIRFQNLFLFSNGVRLDLYGSVDCDCFILQLVDNAEITAENWGGGGAN